MRSLFKSSCKDLGVGGFDTLEGRAGSKLAYQANRDLDQNKYF